MTIAAIPEQQPKNVPLVRLGKYTILAELGQGGMARVYLAVAMGPSGFSKLLVLKVLQRSTTAQVNTAEAFANEGRIASRLNHPNVVQTYEVGAEAGRQFIVMEYLQGQSLFDILAHGKKTNKDDVNLRLSLFLLIICQVLEGLQYVHELCDYDGTFLGLVHRDISPQNVFVTYEGQVKILDFGIAKALGSSTQTAEGVIKGKVAHMAPEQVEAAPIDRRTDLFAVGTILWRACTGVRLWDQYQDVQILQKLTTGDVPPPSSVNSNVPAELERITVKALARSRDERYQTAAELQAELEAFLKGLNEHETARSLGRFVSEQFKTQHQAAKNNIEVRLGQILAQPSGEFSALSETECPGIDILPLVQSRSGTVESLTLSSPGTTDSHITATSEPTLERKRRRFWLMSIALGGAAFIVTLVLVVFGLRLRHNGVESQTHASRPDNSTLMRTPTASSTAPIADNVELRIRVNPAQATVWVDTQKLNDPALSVFPADGVSHKIRAEAKGYEPEAVSVVFDKDAELELNLKPLDAGPQARQAVTKPVAFPASSAPSRGPGKPNTTGDSKPDCSNPIFVNEKGFKAIRPECRD